MGFNFQAGHPEDTIGDGDDIAAMIRARLGGDVPMGAQGDCFCLDDELAWSWWSELQTFAIQEMGEAESAQICGVDAWHGVYVDADVARDVLKLPGWKSDAELTPRVIAHTGPESFLTRVRRFFGLPPKAGSFDAQEGSMIAMMTDMVKKLGPREGERGTIQIGNLRKLIEELEALMAKQNIEASVASVEALRHSYSDDDERVDTDGHIQCLCHAWLTATHAIEHHAPLWLIK